MRLEDIRKDYLKGTLDREHLASNPLVQFSLWMENAMTAGIEEPTATTLATADAYGKPSARVVLLKAYSEDGFAFFTSYASRKASQMESNNFASMLFFWPSLERQIRIEGRIERMDDKISEEYFHSRPFESRVSAAISPQSQVIPNRDFLDQKVEQFIKDHQDQQIPRPDEWGGYMLKPTYLEFWQGRANRLHDRFRYNLIDGVWKIDRLAP